MIMEPIRAELVMFDVDARTLGYRFAPADFARMVRVCNRMGNELLLTPEAVEQTPMPPTLLATLKHRLEDAIAQTVARMEEEGDWNSGCATVKSVLAMQKRTLENVIHWIEEEGKGTP
jgi:hypothetical protein